MTPELYAAIVEAEKATRKAHDLCFKPEQKDVSLWTRLTLGAAQSKLMTIVVRHAGEFPSE